MAWVITRTSLSCSPSDSTFCTAASARFASDFDGDVVRPEGLAAGIADPGGDEALTAFFNSCSLRFFSACLLKSSGLVVLVNAIDFPSVDQTGLPAPLGRSVNGKASPPVIGSMHSCGGSGLPSLLL